jgi:Domain of unknown function (DUF6748)
MIRHLSLATALLACAPGCGSIQDADADAEVTADGKEDKVSTTSTYYLARPDFRRCVSPVCGGVWVHRVNQATTKCGTGKAEAECYVADVDLAALGLDDAQVSELDAEFGAGQALLRGTLGLKSWANFGKLGHFTASEGWAAANGNAPAGTFYRATDNGIRCITTPCFSLHEAKLNSSSSGDVSGLDLAPTGATDVQIADAWNGIAKGGILVAGSNVSDGRGGTTLSATQLYLRVQPAPACDPANEPNRTYIGHSADECAAIRFACDAGQQYFSNACGCGCETIQG